MSSGAPRLDTRHHVHSAQSSSSRQIDSRHDARGGRHDGGLSFSKTANNPELQGDSARGSSSSTDPSSLLGPTTAHLTPTPEFPLYDDDRHSSSFSSSQVSDSRGTSSVVSQPSKVSNSVRSVSGGRQLSIEEAIAGQQATPRPFSLSHSPSGKGSPGKQRATGFAASPAETSKTGERGVERLRSSSIGSLSRESRIAALSVHLRTRLSYAAAKIEKSRQMQKAQDLPPTARIDSLVRSGQLAYLDQVDAQHPEGLGSPASTTMSSPDMYGTAGFNRLVGSARLSPAAWSEAAASPHAGFSRSHHNYHHHHHSHSHIDHSSRPKLAPPVDIISKGGSHGNRRRRPNPNELISPPTFTHRRHHSHQDVGLSQSSANSDTILVPGTPPLQPFGAMPSARHGGVADEQHDRARSSAMEQDAIETLLFMSSPGHSGYHSTHSQHSRRPHRHQNVPRSSQGSQESSLRVPWSRPNSSHSHGQPRARSAEEVTGLEAQAGDEIDRMLDQMDSDSEDDAARIARSRR
ncbi:hypothetical protein ASPACDRAFT_46682 [Aspergillus aculeatus ATCC 16872]|uniref:Uncharacterized protein n=1 Tax=Aspergillus aculeatus (strain ATCC 16872 / CBS 172.66 / WB 5094) TaxID=690307 RepID=A0A1L9WK28_ASPA1|nr:uncharacterized protein ASPACDRAFT_46682 [Aspergillus aculeatus ATCC 16872]OJJ96515.1 hypothetical protein ASPACDRAFT_46682 [Aspergillus aculeatus ATCC 16872]